MLGRLREACGGNYPQLSGIVQIDETYIGGLEENKHESKRKHAGRGAVGKAAVVAMRDESGKTVASPMVYGVNKAWMHHRIAETVEPGSTIYTDESRVYSGLKSMSYNHETVHHKSGEYVRDGVTTNSVESVFAVLKRGIHGVYHHVSEKHLDRYVDEFTFRLNEGNVKRHTLERLESFVEGVAGKRLTYKVLIQ